MTISSEAMQPDTQMRALWLQVASFEQMPGFLHLNAIETKKKD